MGFCPRPPLRIIYVTKSGRIPDSVLHLGREDDSSRGGRIVQNEKAFVDYAATQDFQGPDHEPAIEAFVFQTPRIIPPWIKAA